MHDAHEERAHPAAQRRPRRWLKLPLKTTVLLLTLLMGVVALCGGIFLENTRSILRKNDVAQVSQFAYAISAVIGEYTRMDPGLISAQLESLGKTSNLEFAVLTDVRMREIARFVGKPKEWAAYKDMLGAGDHWMSSGVGQVHNLVHGEHTSYVLTVPVFVNEGAARGGRREASEEIYGYLHVASSGDEDLAQLRYLQVFVLLTCMAMVLGAVPIAGLIARHITVPIERLAEAALALANGDLTHRVANHRSDELGELTDAFNSMADTMQRQQEDIRRINAGLEEKVRHRTAELEKLNKRMAAEMAEKEDFLRAVSHDLNAPLRNIAGMASMLVLKYRDTLEKDALQRLERIQSNVNMECELINELLELSRIKSRREKIERVDLGALVTAVAEGFSSDLETRKITLRMQGHFPVMHCEKSRLRQVFQNLIDNGVKYMREESGRELTLSAKQGKGEMIFAAADTGMGIAAEDLPHLFHVFRRAKNASVMKIPGKGVGLASVKSIVENYNGRLWVESVQGQGTVFYFAIPNSYFELAQEVAA